MYEYRVNVVKVVDGDTVDVDIDLGFGMWIKDERVRIMGIDTPESRTRDKVAPDGRLVTEIMTEGGYCVPYFGGSKEDTQAAHMINRERLISEGKVTL